MMAMLVMVMVGPVHVRCLLGWPSRHGRTGGGGGGGGVGVGCGGGKKGVGAGASEAVPPGMHGMGRMQKAWCACTCVRTRMHVPLHLEAGCAASRAGWSERQRWLQPAAGLPTGPTCWPRQAEPLASGPEGCVPAAVMSVPQKQLPQGRAAVLRGGCRGTSPPLAPRPAPPAGAPAPAPSPLLQRSRRLLPPLQPYGFVALAGAWSVPSDQPTVGRLTAVVRATAAEAIATGRRQRLRAEAGGWWWWWW